MFEAHQLGWIIRNRRKPERSVPVVVAAKGALEDAQRAGTCPSDAVRRAITATGGEDFERHCSLGRVVRGVLIVRVDDDRLVYAYRVRWGRRMAERVRLECPEAGVRGVRFVGGGSA